MVSPPQSPLDGEFETRLEGTAYGIVKRVVKKESTYEILLKQVFFQVGNKEKKYALNQILLYSNEANLFPGNEITVTGTLMKFQHPNNPGEFNFHYYYNSKGISYKMQEKSIEIKVDNKNLLLYVFYQLRESMKNVYEYWLPKDKAGILSAMFLGDKETLSQETRRLYQQNGIGHLLAISGLHVSLIGMGIYKGCLVISKRKKISAILGMLMIIGYGLMTGFSISTNRAVVMGLLSLIAILFGRTYDMLTGIGLSGGIILILHPLEIRNSGFLLSFGAVMGIGLIVPCIEESINWEHRFFKNKKFAGFCKTLIMNISVGLATTPVILFHFYEFPRYGILLNLIVIPMLSLLAVLGMGAGIIGMFSLRIAGIFMGGIYGILEFYEWLCNLFQTFPMHTIVTGKPECSFFVLYYGIIGGTLIFWHIWKKRGVWFLLLFLFLVPILPEINGINVDFLDVGQGDGIYLETREGMKILIDGGSSDRKSLGKYTLEPFLKAKGCRRLDYIFLSHLDDDHINGVEELIEFSGTGGIQIGRVILGTGIVKDEAYENIMKTLKEHEISVGFMKNGSEFEHGPFRIRCLNPESNSMSKDRNDNSLVLEVCYENFSMLLTGDVGESEKKVLEALKKERYDVLKVSHHGSKYSSSEEFLTRVKPKIGVISCSEKNMYGHPHAEVIERLTNAGSEIYMTKECGAVMMRYEKEKLSIKYFKI